MTENHLGKVVDGRYRLDRLLGEGAAGAVYAATQLSGDQQVAVKLLHPDDSSGFSERFQREAEAIAKLDHENIAPLQDFGFDDELGAHFMVTEFAYGIPLSARKKGGLSTESTLKVALEIASALQHAHEQGILHRNLEPGEIVLSQTDNDGEVAKVLDFGIAEIVDPKKKAPDLIEMSNNQMDPFAESGEDEDEGEGEDLEAGPSIEAATAAAKERVGEQEEGVDTAILPPIDLSEDRDPEVQREIDAQFGDVDDSSSESGEKHE